jgi:murein DD-endopeptidase MepM/ murein hydrolase activator NlpD
MIFNNKLKLIEKRRSIVIFAAISAMFMLLSSIIYWNFTAKLDRLEVESKSHKLQIKHQQKHIELITQENQELLCANEMLLAIMDSLPLGSPISDSINISSNYGSRRNPMGTGWRFHSGLDIHAWIYDTIYSTGSGIVKFAGWNHGYGRTIMVEHTGGYVSVYAHLYKIFIQKGDSIKKGQPIGRAGNSGNVTGPHLHYEIRRHGVHTDPIYYIK